MDGMLSSLAKILVDTNSEASEASEGINEAQAHLDQNVLARYATVAPASILDPRGWPLFRCRTAPGQRPASPFWRKRGTRKSRLETNTENEACSALLARLWCHLPLQNPANRAENLTRLCSATIGQTGWRMVQFGAIRSRQKVVQLLAEILKQKSQWRFKRVRVFRVFRPVHGVLRVSR